MKSTAAHSTLTIDNVNSSDIFLKNLKRVELQMFGQKNTQTGNHIGLNLLIMDIKKYLD